MLPFFAYHNAVKLITAVCPARLCIRPIKWGDLLVNEYRLPCPILQQDHRLQLQVQPAHTNQNLQAADTLRGWPVQDPFVLHSPILHLNFATAVPSGYSSTAPKLVGTQILRRPVNRLPNCPDPCIQHLQDRLAPNKVISFLTLSLTLLHQWFRALRLMMLLYEIVVTFVIA